MLFKNFYYFPWINVVIGETCSGQHEPSIILKAKCVTPYFYLNWRDVVILSAWPRVMLKILPRNTQVLLQCCIKRCLLKEKLRLRVDLLKRQLCPCLATLGHFTWIGNSFFKKTTLINTRSFEIFTSDKHSCVRFKMTRCPRHGTAFI